MRGALPLPIQRLWLICLAMLLALAALPAWAALPARPDGPVLDQANVIPAPQEQALDQKLRAYTKATGRAVIVVTASSLDGMDDADYAQKLAEAWQIGGKTSEEGVLFLIAPAERKLRIHTARGVQDRLTDALSGRIIRDTVIPRLRQGDYGGGITAGTDEIIKALNLSPAEAKAIAEAEAAARAQGGQGDGGTLGSALFWIFAIVFFTLLLGGRGRRGMRSGIDPGVALWGAGIAASQWGRGSGGGGSGFDSGFGGFGGGGGGFDGGGASGDW